MLKETYAILNRVYREGAYVGIALNDTLPTVPPLERAAVTQLVYGVLERSATLDYYIDQLCGKRPKPAIQVLLRMGFYRLIYGNVPDYAAVSEAVNLTKAVGKGAQSGFVNAVLKRWSEVAVPADEDEKLSYYSGRPLWYVKSVKRDYPSRYREILNAEVSTLAHVRGAVEYNTPYGAYVGKEQTNKPGVFVQSLGSCAIAAAVGAADGERVLDVCAAPGGKSVNIAQSANCKVQSWDIHPHRVQLIQKYAQRALVSDRVTASVHDATEYESAYDSAFDRVLADVPCSGSGVVFSKPDILLKEPDLRSLNALQRAILSTVSRYVKRGGTLVYSTCSMFACENDGTVGAFLAQNKEFETVKVLPKVPYCETAYGIQLLPDVSGTEGFYYAVMRRL